MSVDANILSSAEYIISVRDSRILMQIAECPQQHHYQSSTDHLERFQGLLRDNLNGLIKLSAQDHSTLLKAINSLLSNNVQVRYLLRALMHNLSLRRGMRSSWIFA